MIEDEVAQLLKLRRLTISAAEACTAGLIGYMLTKAPGSSQYFIGGVTAYANSVKQGVLGAPEALLKERGAVSREVALAMAHGVRRLMSTDIGVSATGIAGPTGGTPERPVGSFFIAIATSSGVETCEEHRWNGDRLANKERAAQAALSLVKIYLLEEL